MKGCITDSICNNRYQTLIHTAYFIVLYYISHILLSRLACFNLKLTNERLQMKYLLSNIRILLCGAIYYSYKKHLCFFRKNQYFFLKFLHLLTQIISCPSMFNFRGSDTHTLIPPHTLTGRGGAHLHTVTTSRSTHTLLPPHTLTGVGGTQPQKRHMNVPPH